MSAPKRKFYVVWKGRRPGVYPTWAECQAQVTGFSGARFKSFASRAEAERAFREDSADDHYRVGVGEGRGKSDSPRGAGLAELGKTSAGGRQEVIADSISVDAACSGNPGVLEYRGVDTGTGEELFRMGPFADGTNNIGEFLAIVHALQMHARQERNRPIYSDSEIAIKWVRGGTARTKLPRSDANRRLFALLSEAERWLAENKFETPILKWETDRWGENPADFGRK